MHFQSLLLIILLFTTQLCKSQSFSAELLNQETHIYVDKGRLTRKIFWEIRINNRAGEKYTNIKIYYQGLVQIKNLEASICDPSGKILKKLDKSDIQEVNYSSDNALYQDVFIKKFTLKHNEYPYIIRYSYEESMKEFLSLANWVPILDNDIPTRNATLTLETPTDYKIHYSSRLINSPLIDKNAEKTKYCWTAQYLKVLDTESYAPPISNFFPQLEIVPDKFTYAGNGSFSSWKNYGIWEASLLSDLNDLTNYDIAVIQQQIEGMTDKREQVKKLYQYLQDQTRYINISIKTGGMKPQKASYTSIKKYGDCKGLSNYFKSILDAAGINSFYTNINAGYKIEPFNTDFPSMQFNHIIICVPIQSDTLWLDCTSKESFNGMSPFIQNREVFVINGDNSFFTKTPALKPKDVLCSRHIEINQVIGTMDASLKLQEEHRGSSYSNLFYLQKYATEKELDNYIRKQYTDLGMDVSAYQFSSPCRDSSHIGILGEAITRHILNKYGNDLLLFLVPFEITKPEKIESRKLPVQIDFPQFLSDTLVYTLPPNKRISKLPENKSVSNEFGEYDLKYILIGDKLTIVKSFLLNAGNYPFERYPDFYTFIASIIEFERSPYIVVEL